ncbi:MAG: sulfotransferase family 2 domain-containing protein [Rhodobacter sp.]|nr:sulfotransferase family 2 domain-containing protein [Rhodobacter sp.]
MIIPEKKLFYIKIPKTGSTSVAQVIWQAYGIGRNDRSDRVINLNWPAEGPLDHRGWHMSLDRILDHLGADADRYRGFTVIREPVERMMSVYRWAKSKATARGNPCLDDFAAFLTAVFEDDARLPPQARLHSLPQCDWLRGGGAWSGELSIFTLDRLQECGRYLSQVLGPYPEFPHVNVSEKFDVTVPSDMHARLKDHYAEDFALYHRTKTRPLGR